MSSIGGEKGLVQNPLIKYATDIGWTYVSPAEAVALRGGETGIVFKEVCITQLQKLNSFMTQQLAEDLIKKTESIPANIEGNLLAWEYLKGLKQILVPAEKRERDVRFMDTEMKPLR